VEQLISFPKQLRYIFFYLFKTDNNIDEFVKSSNSRRANFVITRRTNRTLSDYEMQHNTGVGLFTKPSILEQTIAKMNVILWYFEKPHSDNPRFKTFRTHALVPIRRVN